MSWFQKTIRISAKPRGCHLITNDIVHQIPELKNFSIGLAHFFIQHTTASLTINENWDPTVRKDMEDALNSLAPEDRNWRHSIEGPDDFPGHAKATIVGSSITIPISNGALNLGTWQGIWLCEHRNSSSSRSIVITLQGQTTNE